MVLVFCVSNYLKRFFEFVEIFRMRWVRDGGYLSERVSGCVGIGGCDGDKKEMAGLGKIKFLR